MLSFSIRLLWSEYRKQLPGQATTIRLKTEKKCCLVRDFFRSVKINVFRPFFAFRLEMYVRCDNQYKTGADRENILGQPMLFKLKTWLAAFRVRRISVLSIC